MGKSTFKVMPMQGRDEVKPISKQKLLSDLYANAKIHQLTASYLFNVVARDEALAARSRRLAEKIQYRAVKYYQRARTLENIDVDIIKNQRF